MKESFLQKFLFELEGTWAFPKRKRNGVCSRETFAAARNGVIVTEFVHLQWTQLALRICHRGRSTRTKAGSVHSYWSPSGSS